jgi:hypothetical protein
MRDRDFCGQSVDGATRSVGERRRSDARHLYNRHVGLATRISLLGDVKIITLRNAFLLLFVYLRWFPVQKSSQFPSE